MLKQPIKPEVADEVTDLISCICTWSVERQLDRKVTALDQIPKLYEELGECMRAYQKKDSLQLMDGLGDTIVVLGVMLSQFRTRFVDGNFTQNFSNALKNTLHQVWDGNEKGCMAYFTDQIGITVDRFVLMQSFTSKEIDEIQALKVYDRMACLIESAIGFANYCGVDFLQCLRMAYSTIYFRKGKLENGVFVKIEPERELVVKTDVLQHRTPELLQHLENLANGQAIKLKYEI